MKGLRDACALTSLTKRSPDVLLLKCCVAIALILECEAIAERHGLCPMALRSLLHCCRGVQCQLLEEFHFELAGMEGQEMCHFQSVLQDPVHLLLGPKCLPAGAAAHQMGDLHCWGRRQKQLPEKLACLDQQQTPGTAAAAGRLALQQLQIGAAADCSCLAAQQVGCWERQLLQQVLLPGLHQQVGLQRLQPGALQMLLQSWVGVD